MPIKKTVLESRNDFVLYRHIRPDKNEPFYIGIGTYKRSEDFKYGRNRHWRNIFNINKSQIQVDVLLENLTWKEACRFERWWVAFYGRSDLGKGTLCNLTDGGDGTTGPKSKEATDKRVAKMLGVPLSKEHRAKLRESKLGSKNPMFGNPNIAALAKAHKAACRKVKDMQTGEIFNSIIDAAKTTKYSTKHVMAMLAGRKTNKTNLIKL